MPFKMIEMIQDNALDKTAMYRYSFDEGNHDVIVDATTTYKPSTETDSHGINVFYEYLSIKVQLHHKKNHEKTTMCEMSEKKQLEKNLAFQYFDSVVDAVILHMKYFDYFPVRLMVHTTKTLDMYGKNMIDYFCPLGYTLSRKMELPVYENHIGYLFVSKGVE